MLDTYSSCFAPDIVDSKSEYVSPEIIIKAVGFVERKVKYIIARVDGNSVKGKCDGAFVFKRQHLGHIYECIGSVNMNLVVTVNCDSDYGRFNPAGVIIFDIDIDTLGI